MVTVIIVVIVCLLAEGFFSGSELAMVACDKIRLKKRSREGSRHAKQAEELLSKPARLFSITLLGTNLSTVMASTVTTVYLIKTYGPAYGSLAILLSPIILVFAEIIPKSVFHHRANRLVDRVAPILLAFASLCAPIIWAVHRLTDRLLGGVRKATGSEKRIDRVELASILHGEETQGTDIRPSERTTVSRVLRLADLKAKNIMVPLIETESLPLTATRNAAFEIFNLKGCARLPVYTNRVYDVVGILEATDVLCAGKAQALSELVHQPTYVPEDMRLNELFRYLRERKQHAAVVVDEYGGALGIVTLEEIFEEVVGEIRDEFELDEQLFQKLGESHFHFLARMEVEEAQAAMGLETPAGDYETMAGMLLHHFGYIPCVGESITVGRWKYHIRRATERAIVEVEAKLV